MVIWELISSLIVLVIGFNWIYFFVFLLLKYFQINEEASDKVLEVEQKYNVVRKPVYDKRSEVIKAIPDFWLTAVSDSSCFVGFY